MVAMDVGMDTHLKQYSQLCSNTYHVNHRSSLYLEKNLRFRLLYLVTRDFCIQLPGKLSWTFNFFKIYNVDLKTFPMSPRSSLYLQWLLR